MTTDRIGMVFELLEELGEDPRFRFALQRVATGEPLTTLEISHAACDGFGGMSRLLRREGIAYTAPAQRADAAPPSWRERLRALVRIVRHRPASPLALVPRASAWRPGDRVTERPEAGRILSAEVSAQIFAAARAAGASVTSYLLHGLTEAVAPDLAVPSPTVTWAVPVNMRGPLRVADDANGSSLMPVDVPRGGTPGAVHGALQQALAANLHWGKWDQLHTAARLGRRILKKKIAAHYATAGTGRIGVFSNVGVWTGASAPDVGVIAYGVPVLPDPLFAVALTWNGKLALSLRAHPSLGVDDVTVARWLDAWCEHALGAPFTLSEGRRPASKGAGAVA